MLFGKLFKKKGQDELLEILIATRDLLNQHDNISWDGLSPAEAAMDLSIEIEKVENGSSVNKKHLGYLFAPTGIIQECSISNDWSEKYLELSKRFDRLIADY